MIRGAAILLALVLGVLLLYRETAAEMVGIWSRSDTFAHCFLVPPIVLWLVWRRRGDLAAMAPAPAPWLLLPIAGAGMLWLLGDLAASNAVSQFALVLMIVLLVPAVAGLPAAKTLLFPLGFLFFAVPLGEFSMPWLMAHTADFTVLALRVTGIPVYQEGLQFIIPSGAWSVVEACSGLRYLIASLMVGTLFAYLNYRSMRRRWIFAGVALLVPIVANWLRAYFTVLLGHYSGNKLAVGVDHLIYGWAFFGVVMVLLYALGRRWSEADPALDPEPRVAVSKAASRPSAAPWAMASASALVLAIPVHALQAIVAHEERSAPLLADPLRFGSRWTATDAGPQWTPAFQKPAAQLQHRYVADGQPVGLYVGYYRGQGIDSKLVSSSNELVRSSDKEWIQVGTGSREVALPDRLLTLRTARLRRPPSATDVTSLAVWQVYWVNGTLTSSHALAKAYGAFYRLVGKGDDGAAVIVYAAEARPGSADAQLEAFVRDALPTVEAHLRRSRDGD
jgi:exosortase A